MSIGVRDRKLLWGRSGNRCAFPQYQCNRELTIEVSLTLASTAVGNECHIVARKTDGPRGTSALSAEQRDTYENLILLCPEHHKVIDEEVQAFTVEVLRTMREEHNAQIRSKLDPATFRFLSKNFSMP